MNSPLSVLVAEDLIAQCYRTSESCLPDHLGSMGDFVFTVENPLEAITTLRARTDFDLLITDTRFHRLDTPGKPEYLKETGVDIVRALVELRRNNEQYSKVKVIVLAESIAEVYQALMIAKVDGWLVRPFTYAKLEELIQNIFG